MHEALLSNSTVDVVKLLLPLTEINKINMYMASFY
jgi:hypothetical protein